MGPRASRPPAGRPAIQFRTAGLPSPGRSRFPSFPQAAISAGHVRNKFSICEPLHTARILPSANVAVPCIVVAMRLGRTTTMSKSVLISLSTRSLVTAAAIAGALAIAAPTPAEAWVSNGAAVGIGLGSFALGTMVGSAAANPYGYYPYGYYAPAPAYYATPTPVYSQPRTCWYPQYRGYYAC